jgi:predicted ABC-type ATPase
MLEEIDHHAAAGESFAFETTLAGHTYERRIRKWRESGYVVKLVFLSLPTPDDAIARVAARVQQGGHDVPVEVIRRRFATGLRNFLDIYRDLADSWQWIDNSIPNGVLLEEGTHDE